MKTPKTVICGLIALIFALAFIACEGPTGPAGQQGQQGQQGEKGDKGDNGNNGENGIVGGIDEITITVPTKIDYLSGDPFISAGLTVTAHHADGFDLAIIRGYTLNWNGQTIQDGNTAVTATAGDKTITVDWHGRTKSFTVTVTDINNLVVTNTDQWNYILNLIRITGNNRNYTIYINGNVPVPGGSNSFGSVSGISVTLKGNGKLYLTSQGWILLVGRNQTLIIDSANLTLEGLTNGKNGATEDNYESVVYIEDAQLELKNGTISGNIYSSSYIGGGGVAMFGGSFTMTGGTISGNTSYNGSGGVYVHAGSFNKTGGIIYGNDDPNTADRNTSTMGNTNGHAVLYRISNNVFCYRDTTLNTNDNISTADPLPTVSGQTLSGWTRR